MTQSDADRIRHTVIFKLTCKKGSVEEQDFFNAAKLLANINGVEKFECLEQISKQNKYEYGLSMEFSSQDLYDRYTNHPDHISFVKNKWLKEVDDFMEIDYLVLK